MVSTFASIARTAGTFLGMSYRIGVVTPAIRKDELPAKEGSHFTGEKLAELTDDLLLFLRKLRTITIAEDMAGAKRVYKRTDEAGIVTLTSEAFEAGSEAPTVSRRKFRNVRQTYSTTNIKEEKRQDVEEAAVVLAFPITDDGVASADSTQSLFAFLPVVEYATEPSLQRLYKIQDPYGKTNQFRFDSGWKSVVTGAAEVMDPAEGRRVSIEGLGAGTILSVTEAGVLRRLSIRLDSGEELTRTYDPTKMSVSEQV